MMSLGILPTCQCEILGSVLGSLRFFNFCKTIRMAVEEKLYLDLFSSAFGLNVSWLLGVLRNPGGGVTTANIFYLLYI